MVSGSQLGPADQSMMTSLRDAGSSRLMGNTLSRQLETMEQEAADIPDDTGLSTSLFCHTHDARVILAASQLAILCVAPL